MTDDAEAMARAAVDLAATSELSVDDALRVIAEAARLLAAADIVRRLVQSDPLVTRTDSSEDGEYDWSECGICGVTEPREPDQHTESCPWRRAVEWVSTQETDDGV